jgi:hypothetical protein
MEYVWGPQSGFGGRDLARPTTCDDTPFDYADEIFNSIDEALDYLRNLKLSICLTTAGSGPRRFPVFGTCASGAGPLLRSVMSERGAMSEIKVSASQRALQIVALCFFLGVGSFFALPG